MPYDTRSEYYCGTWNNYTDEDMLVFPRMFSNNELNYYVSGQETGESGTRHLQFYLEFPKRIRHSQLKRLLPRCYLAKREKTAQQASDYCKKEGNFQEEGELSKPQQGKRNDIEAVAQLVAEGKTAREIAKAYPAQWIKFSRGIEDLRKVLSSEHQVTEFTEFRWEINVTKTHVFQGLPGIGKTEYAKYLLPKALFVTHMDDLLLYDPDEYNGIIFDDMSFEHLPREAQIHIADFDNPRSIHIRYRVARIPAKTIKIFTTNKQRIFIDDGAINRRIEMHYLE